MPVRDVKVREYSNLIEFLKESPAHFEAFKQLYNLPDKITLHDLHELDIYEIVDSDTTAIQEILNYLCPHRNFLVHYNEHDDKITVTEIIFEVKPALPPVDTNVCINEYKTFLKRIKTGVDEYIKSNTVIIKGQNGTKVIKVLCEKLFIYLISKLPVITGVYRVIAPRFETPECGAIYYIVHGIDTVYFFKGMFGYCGEGPRQSAFIETMLRKIVPLKPKDYPAEHLLSLLKIC